MKSTNEILKYALAGVLIAGLIFIVVKQMPEPLPKGDAECASIPQEPEYLRKAAEHNCFETVKEIVRQSRPRVQQVDTGFIPDDEARLLVASLTNDTETVKNLLSKYKNPKTIPMESFRFACREGNADVVLAFINAGIDVNAELMNACEQGWPVIVKMILRLKTNANIDKGKAFVVAASAGHFPIVKEFIDNGIDVNEEDGMALVLASSNGDSDIVKELLKAGADINAQEGGALVFASAEGHLDIVKELLKAKANVNAGNGFALLLASGNGHLDVVKELLNAKADVNKTPSKLEGTTPWAMATGHGHPDVVATLERAGAKGDAVQRGRALFFTVFKDDEETAKKLLNAKADLSLKDEKGKTALMVAQEKGAYKVAKLLEGKQ